MTTMNGGGSVSAGGGGGDGEVPPGASNIVQGLREIVNNSFTDEEIYSALSECQMDPTDAIDRLLSQDTFREVKSKRERRKEMKETHEYKVRDNDNAYRVIRIGGERDAGRIQSQISCNDLGKAPYRRENGLVAPVTSVPSRVKTIKEEPSPLPLSCGISISDNNKREISGVSDTIPSSIKLTAVAQSAWLGDTAGHASMADVVKMGRLQSRTTQTAKEASNAPQDEDLQNSSYSRIRCPCDSSHSLWDTDLNFQCQHHSHISKENTESTVSPIHHDFDNDLSNQNAVNGSSLLNASPASCGEKHSRISNLIGDGAKLPEDSQLKEIRVYDGEISSMNPRSSCVEFNSPSSTNQSLNGTASHSSEGARKGSDVFLSNDNAPSNHEVLSAAVNFKRLDLGKDPTVPSSEEKRVIFPDYILASSADCSHLSFGTYKSCTQAAISGPLSSYPTKIKLERGHPLECLDARNSGYLNQDLLDDQHRSIFGGHQLTADADHDSSISLLPEIKSKIISKVSGGHECIQPSFLPHSNPNKIQDPNSLWSAVLDINDRNLDLNRHLQANSVVAPVDLFSSLVQSSEVLSHALSPPEPRSMPLMYANELSSYDRPITPLSKIPNSYADSKSFACSPTLPVNSIATSAMLSAHLSAHVLAQCSNSDRELTELTGYPAMPHIRNLPTSMQQAYPDSDRFYDAIAGRKYGFSQYTGAPLRSGLHHADLGVSSYGGLPGQADFEEGYLRGLSTSSAGPVPGHGVLPAQYQDRSKFPMLQQNGNSSRELSSVPDNPYLRLPGQNHLLSVRQQAPQLPQDYGVQLDANVYHSQAGITREVQKQRQSHSGYSNLQPSNHTNFGSSRLTHYWF